MGSSASAYAPLEPIENAKIGDLVCWKGPDVPTFLTHGGIIKAFFGPRVLVKPINQHNADILVDKGCLQLVGDGYRLVVSGECISAERGDEWCTDKGWQKTTLSENSEHVKNGLGERAMRRKIVEPKVGDWVKIVKPANATDSGSPFWQPQMDQYVGTVAQVRFVAGLNDGDKNDRVKFESGVAGNCWYHFDWLVPVEAPVQQKAPEKEPLHSLSREEALANMVSGLYRVLQHLAESARAEAKSHERSAELRTSLAEAIEEGLNRVAEDIEARGLDDLLPLVGNDEDDPDDDEDDC